MPTATKPLSTGQRYALAVLVIDRRLPYTGSHGVHMTSLNSLIKLGLAERQRNPAYKEGHGIYFHDYVPTVEADRLVDNDPTIAAEVTHWRQEWAKQVESRRARAQAVAETFSPSPEFWSEAGYAMDVTNDTYPALAILRTDLAAWLLSKERIDV